MLLLYVSHNGKHTLHICISSSYKETFTFILHHVCLDDESRSCIYSPFSFTLVSTNFRFSSYLILHWLVANCVCQQLQRDYQSIFAEMRLSLMFYQGKFCWAHLLFSIDCPLRRKFQQLAYSCHQVCNCKRNFTRFHFGTWSWSLKLLSSRSSNSREVVRQNISPQLP